MSLRPTRPSPRPYRSPRRRPVACRAATLLVAVVLLGSACVGSGPPAPTSAVHTGTMATGPRPGSGSVVDPSPPASERADECLALMILVNATLLPTFPDGSSTAADRAVLDEWLDDVRARGPMGFEADLTAMEVAVAMQVEALAELHRDAVSTGTWPADADIARLLAAGTQAFDDAGSRVMAWIDTECEPEVLGAANDLMPGA